MAEDSTSMLRPETHATIRLRNDDDDLYFIIVTKCIWPLGGGVIDIRSLGRLFMFPSVSSAAVYRW